MLQKHKAAYKERHALGANMARLLATRPQTDPIKLRIHKALVPDIIETYLSDAEKLDKDFDLGTTMVDALQGTYQKAVDDPISLKAEDHFDETAMRNMHAWIDMLINVFKTDPSGIARKLNKQRVAKVLGAPSGKIIKGRENANPKL